MVSLLEQRPGCGLRVPEYCEPSTNLPAGDCSMKRSRGALAATIFLVISAILVPWLLVSSASPDVNASTTVTAIVPPVPANANPSANASFDTNGVSCPQAGWCVAVGFYDDTNGLSGVTGNTGVGVGPATSNEQGLIDTLSAGAWSTTQAPLPSNAVGAVLIAVSCASVGSCTAVGDFVDGTGDEFALVETLSDGAWAATSVPVSNPPSGADEASLSFVTCSDPNSCDAVGNVSSGALGGPAFLTAATETDGAWASETLPGLPGTGTNVDTWSNLSCPASGWCEAIGNLYESPSAEDESPSTENIAVTLADGTWTDAVLTTPSDTAYIDSLSCWSAGSCVAVGQSAIDGDQALAETLSGGVWTPSDVPSPAGTGDDVLESVACPAADQCEAVGSDGEDEGTGVLIASLTGGLWTSEEAPLPSGYSEATMGDVACGALGSCTAVGILNPYQLSPAELVETLTGGTWTPTEAPLPASPGMEVGPPDFTSTSCASTTSCVAVGFENQSNSSLEWENGFIDLITTPAPPPVPVSVSISANPTSTRYGGSVTYSAVVSSGAGVPTGTVVFSESATYLCTATLADGEGSCSSTSAQVGDDTVEGAYSGDSIFAASSGTTTLTVSAPSPPPPPPPPPITSPSTTHGYWLVGSDGGIFSFGSAQFYGSTGSLKLQRPVVGIVPTTDKGGYWLDASDGGVFTYGDTQYYGSIPGLGLHPAGSGLPNSLNAPIVGMVPSNDDGGYFMVASDGGVFAFGDAHFAGSCPGIGGCSGAAVAVMPDASGNGYWLVTQTGNVYTFGDASYYGAPGNTGFPVTSAVRTPNGGGYWILTANGTVYNYGDAGNYGDAAGAFGGFNPATAIFTTSDGAGYWIASANGTVDQYGDAPNDGDMSGTKLNGSIIAATGF